MSAVGLSRWFPDSATRFRDDKYWWVWHPWIMVGDRIYFTYMMASRPYGTVYTGVTNDLILRSYEHREELVAGFTRKHKVHLLVWFEQHRDINFAILREKRIKRWRRDWKVALIEESNPHWEDYYPKLIEAGWRVERQGFTR